MIPFHLQEASIDSQTGRHNLSPHDSMPLFQAELFPGKHIMTALCSRTLSTLHKAFVRQKGLLYGQVSLFSLFYSSVLTSMAVGGRTCSNFIPF